jgi:hypothetical protein
MTTMAATMMVIATATMIMVMEMMMAMATVILTPRARVTALESAA